MPKRSPLLCVVALSGLLLPSLAGAQETSLATQVSTLSTHLDWLWTCVAAFLVFFMQAGFALVEAGFTRAKNAVNILMKNAMDFAIGSIAFWAIGFSLMFGASSGIFGWGEFFPNPDVNAYGEQANWMYAFLIFQTVFAATAATIVSGAMAERTKFSSYLIYSIIVTAIIYPISGSWAWGGLWHGGGWLEGMGFIDFAGSTVVHSVGGWLALAGAIVLGPRRGASTIRTAVPTPSSATACPWPLWEFSSSGSAGSGSTPAPRPPWTEGISPASPSSPTWPPRPALSWPWSPAGSNSANPISP